MPSTGSRLSGWLGNRQLRSSCSGPAMPIDNTGSNPSSRRTITLRFAHGHARATTSRYRPGSTGHGDEPSEGIRSVSATGSRSKASVLDRVAVIQGPSVVLAAGPVVVLLRDAG